MNVSFLLRWAAIPLALVLVSCGKTEIGTSSDVSVVQTGNMPVPTRSDLTASERPYFLGPYDKVRIDVFGVPDLNRVVQIDASGRISYPLIGVIEAAGRTPGELAESIEARLRDRFVRQPQVTVNLEEGVSQLLTVDGEVRNPGVFPVLGKMTLVQAVARAGGTSEFARLRDVVVFRNVQGQRYAGLYNLDAIRRANYPDPEVYAGDIVVVGNSRSKRFFRDLVQASALLTTPLIILFN